jgi:hypothetical protein
MRPNLRRRLRRIAVAEGRSKGSRNQLVLHNIFFENLMHATTCAWAGSHDNRSLPGSASKKCDFIGINPLIHFGRVECDRADQSAQLWTAFDLSMNLTHRSDTNLRCGEAYCGWEFAFEEEALR